MGDYERIRVAREGAVETITLSYSQRGNAIGPRMIGELLHALGQARADEGVRAIVLTGEGKAFCVGGDFAQMSGGASDTLAGSGTSLGDFGDLLLALAKSDKPVVARVNGNALGGGLGLVAACTFAVASRDAKLGTPEVDVGLFPMIIMAMLARVMPRRRLLEMMLFGQKIDADEAVRVGLLNRAVPADDLDAEVGKIVAAIAAKSPMALRLGLRAFAAQDELELERALPLLRERLAEILSTDDFREGVSAFLEKRAPRWTGK